MLTNHDLLCELRELLNNQDMILDKDEDVILVYNDRLEHYEVFDDLGEILRSAIHHRTFQQCI